MADGEPLTRTQNLEEENRRLREQNSLLKSDRRKIETDQWEALHSKVDAIKVDIKDARREVAANTTVCSNVETKVTRLHQDHLVISEIIRGKDMNPETGLHYRLKTIEDKQDEMKKKQAESEKWWWGVAAAALVALGKSLVDLIWSGPK